MDGVERGGRRSGAGSRASLTSGAGRWTGRSGAADAVTGHRRRAGTQGNDGVEEGGAVGAAREVLVTMGAVGEEESVGNAGKGDERRGKGGVERAAGEKLGGYRRRRGGRRNGRQRDGRLPAAVREKVQFPASYHCRSGYHRSACPALLRPRPAAAVLRSSRPTPPARSGCRRSACPAPLRPRTCSAPAAPSFARSSRRRPAPPK
ncbi:hypothetical protein [Oryza sativa Japonica Group]|uniref:Uncharacterized protein n=1 Tax=Oryza sativa subsp. japonica TaxID=39947 RepID=Q5N9H3_ORYSJ|nr:hypothetical protein [Oryza sativa Japonica Group]BAD81894.1 hypothetical protein [Oryza sativa Japonica Group]